MTDTRVNRADRNEVPDNPWATTGSYDPREFLVGSTDKKGHSRSVKVSIPPSVLGQLQAIIQQRRIPDYRTMADIVRDALQHRLWWLNEVYFNDPSLQSVLDVERSLSVSRQLVAAMQRWDEFVKEADDALRVARDLADTRRLGELIEFYETGLLLGGLDEPYRTRLAEVLDRYRQKAD